MVRTWLPSFVLLGLVVALVILTNPTLVNTLVAFQHPHKTNPLAAMEEANVAM